jgi:hypothetical protein
MSVVASAATNASFALGETLLLAKRLVGVEGALPFFSV